MNAPRILRGACLPLALLLGLCSGGCSGSGSSPAFGQAAIFDGTTAYIMVGSGETTRAMNSPFTVESFVQAAEAPTGGPATIFAATDSQSAGGGSIQLTIGLNLTVTGQFTSCGGATTFATTSSTALNPGSPYHIAMTSDGAGHLNLFINGTLQTGSIATPASTACTFDNWMVGASIITGGGLPPNQTPINYYEGAMDELRYSKVVRYTSSFSIPTAPFSSDTNTLLLLHMNFNTSATSLGPGDTFFGQTSVVSYNNVFYGNSPF